MAAHSTGIELRSRFVNQVTDENTVDIIKNRNDTTVIALYFETDVETSPQ
ncbi:MAG: hypothetical protein WB711_11845 [Terriglobales bacterium]